MFAVYDELDDIIYSGTWAQCWDYIVDNGRQSLWRIGKPVLPVENLLKIV